jgi:hypothetical protein
MCGYGVCKETRVVMVIEQRAARSFLVQAATFFGSW